jgi:F-type H+-transporting ATPase subunit b
MNIVTPGIGIIFWQTLTFLLLVLILSRFVWRPIMSAIRTREASIEDAIRAAELARDEMERLTADNEKLMAEARLERDHLIKEAATVATKIRDEAREEASKIADKLLKDTRHTIDLEKQAFLSEMKNQVAELSLIISEKILRKSLEDEPEQKKLIDQYLKDVKLN